jgi:hypothetical protein
LPRFASKSLRRYARSVASAIHAVAPN